MEIRRPPAKMAGKRLEWAMGTAVTGAKGLVFLSGVTGRDPQTGQVVEGGIDAQMMAIFVEVKNRLEELGTSMENICHVRMDWTDPSGVLDALQKVWKELCPRCALDNPDRDPPPSTGLGVAQLHAPGMLIEITVTAAIP